MNYKGEKIDFTRFQRRGYQILFKSRIAISKESKHYNKWYVIANVPPDVRPLDVGVLNRAIAWAFVDKGHRPLSDDEVRAIALSYVLAA